MARQTREGRRFSDELLDELLSGDDPAEEPPRSDSVIKADRLRRLIVDLLANGERRRVRASTRTRSYALIGCWN